MVNRKSRNAFFLEHGGPQKQIREQTKSGDFKIKDDKTNIKKEELQSLGKIQQKLILMKLNARKMKREQKTKENVELILHPNRVKTIN